jgi:hypothetical protein
MNSGFVTWKDVLQVAVIPVALALLALLWPWIQSRARRRSFKALIIRELRELAPYPENAQRGQSWSDHQRKKLIHQKIFQEPSANRDFILSLQPDLVYMVSQLWDARGNGDEDQWLYSLHELGASRYDRTDQIRRVHKEWNMLILQYHHLRNPEFTGF